MPSMVVDRRGPRPRRRARGRSRPAGRRAMTLQAPQSPLRSLPWCRSGRASSRSTSSSVSLRLAEELGRLAVDGRGDVKLGHQSCPPARARRRSRAARLAARRRPWCGYSMVPRLSSIGRQAARRRPGQPCPAPPRRACVPISACGGLRHQQHASAPPRPAPRAPRCTTPLASSVRLTPAPTTAMSISVRGMKRR